MNSVKQLLGIFAAAILIAVGAQAEGAGESVAPHAPGDVIAAILDLDVTADQHRQVANILKANRGEVHPLVERMIAARKALFEQIHAEDFDEVAVRDAAATVAAVEVELAVHRARMVQELRPVLTAEQHDKMRALKDKVCKRVTTHLGLLHKLVSRWIDTNAG